MTEQTYIHQLLEPDDRIIVGNAKRYGLLELPPRKPVVDVVPVETEPKCYGGRWEEHED